MTQQWLVKMTAIKTLIQISTIYQPKAMLPIYKSTDNTLEQKTYIGVTYDQQLTWKAQTDQEETQGELKTYLNEKAGRNNVGPEDSLHRESAVCT